MEQYLKQLQKLDEMNKARLQKAREEDRAMERVRPEERRITEFC